MTIRAIETEYNGRKFRSRLEARWAVFFDALGVKYEYEPEGFVLPSGKQYLPDFRVKCYGLRGACCEPNRKNEFDLCSSCKYGYGNGYEYQGDCKHRNWTPETAKGDADNNELCCECGLYELDTSIPFDLYIEVKGKMTQEDADRIWEFTGLSGNEEYGLSEYPVLVVGDIPSENCCCDSYDCGAYDNMDGIDIRPFNYETIDGDMFAAYPAAHNKKFYLWGDDSNYINTSDEDEIEAAYRAARQARFEYGETPMVNHGK